jgi:hypothetical protein
MFLDRATCRKLQLGYQFEQSSTRLFLDSSRCVTPHARLLSAKRTTQTQFLSVQDAPRGSPQGLVSSGQPKHHGCNSILWAPSKRRPPSSAIPPWLGKALALVSWRKAHWISYACQDGLLPSIMRRKQTPTYVPAFDL